MPGKYFAPSFFARVFFGRYFCGADPVAAEGSYSRLRLAAVPNLGSRIAIALRKQRRSAPDQADDA